MSNYPKAHALPCFGCGKQTYHVHPHGIAFCKGCQGRMLYDDVFRQECAQRLERMDNAVNRAPLVPRA